MVSIWDKEKNTLISSDSRELYIGADGKVYELGAACMGGDVWLNREDVSNRYEVRFSQA